MLMTFCYENNIILCCLPSHTSYKLQPCDVGIFGPLKIAYRKEVEQLYCGGSNMIGKQHFTLLYDCARRTAMTSQNTILGWFRTGLRPFSPERVLKEIQKPEMVKYSPLSIDDDKDSFSQVSQLETLNIFDSLASLRKSIEMNITQHEALNARTKLSIQKVVNAAENAFADRAILLDENLLLFEQNNEKNTCTSIKATFVGIAKVLSYEDIVEV
jgi:DDE superfamily endonuclease